jgi:peptidase M28-like protein
VRRTWSVVVCCLAAIGACRSASTGAREAAAPSAEVIPPVPNVLPLKYAGPPTHAAIAASDMMTRLYILADDSMMGRSADSPYNAKGALYIEREVRRFGLKPAGDNGTYFQFPLEQRELDPAAAISVHGRALRLWTDFAPRDQGPGARAFDGATVVYAGSLGDPPRMLGPAAVAGKIALVTVAKDSLGRGNFNVNRGQLTVRFRDAAAIAVVSIDYIPPGYIDQYFRTPQIGPKGDFDERPVPSFLYVTKAVARAMVGRDAESAQPGAQGDVVRGQVRYVAKDAPARNVVAIIPGSDPALRGQYIAIGAHNDHIGFTREPADHDSVKAYQMVARPQGADNEETPVTEADWTRIRHIIDSLHTKHAARRDSIYNGADDDGSGTTTVLEIAEAFASAKVKPKRSLLFVWHTGEELGLLGSSYFTDHPTVPRDSIVAQLNIDMVGRGGANDITGVTKAGQLIHGGPGYVQLIGSRRLSSELGDIAESVNKERGIGLAFDYSLDANGHPQNIYCRSDHYMYARYGIPIIFFTTGGHADYHQVTDEPQYIDYNRMEQVGKLVYAIAERVGSLDHRVVVDKPKPDPRGGCRQ